MKYNDILTKSVKWFLFMSIVILSLLSATVLKRHFSTEKTREAASEDYEKIISKLKFTEASG